MITEEDYEGMTCQWITSMFETNVEMCRAPREYGKPYCIYHCDQAYLPFVCEPVEQASVK